MHAQHLAAFDIPRHHGLRVFGHQRVRRPLRALFQRRTNLRKVRHVGITQYQVDLRMSDQSAAGIYHIGSPRHADPDVGHDVPNELEIDLRDDHAVLATPSPHRNDHEGFGPPLETNRSEINPVRYGLGESGVVRKIGRAGAPRTDGKTKIAKLLAAFSVELSQLRYRFDLAQKPFGIELPVIGRICVPGKLSCPTELAFELLHELPDPYRRGPGLLVLNAA